MMTGFSAGTAAACCVAASTGVVALVVKMSMGRKRACAQIRLLNFIERSPMVWRHHRLNLGSGRRTDTRPLRPGQDVAWGDRSGMAVGTEADCDSIHRPCGRSPSYWMRKRQQRRRAGNNMQESYRRETVASTHEGD